MLKKLFILLFFFSCPILAFGEDAQNTIDSATIEEIFDDADYQDETDQEDDEAEYYSITKFLEREANSTPCATAVFQNALKNYAYMIKSPDDADATDIDTWTHYAFFQPDVLTELLNCPEMQEFDDDDTIIFEPVFFTFDNGRMIQINYETQKKVLTQKLLLANKKMGPGDINPDIAKDVEAGNIWINVDPAWYAIVVAEHDSLKDYVGPGKNNIVSTNFIQDNIKQFYPKDHAGPFRAECTSRTAIAGDTDMINRAVTRTVGGVPEHEPLENLSEEEQKLRKEAKTNDYYVMGEGDLSGIGVLELTADVVLTVITAGGFAAAKGAITAIRATKIFKNSQRVLKTLSKSQDVIKFTQVSNKLVTLERAIKASTKLDNFDDIAKLTREANQNVRSLERKLELLKARGAQEKAIATVSKELEAAKGQAEIVNKAAKTAEKMLKNQNILKNGKELSPDKLKKMEKNAKNIEKASDKLAKNKQLTHNQQKTLKNKKTTLSQKNKQLEKQKQLTEAEKQALETENKELAKTYEKQLDELKTMYNTEVGALRETKDVKSFEKIVQAKREAAHTAYLLRQGKLAFQARRGLLPMRAYRAAKFYRAGLKSGKNLGKAAETVRRASTSGLSTRINDWLFHNTLKNLQALSKVPAALQILKMVVKTAGDMYDLTYTSTGEFTNNIDLHPYLLLAADNLKGYENVVNQGMWLFWAGSSTSAANDDAAYLEAMSFAERFHQDLVEIQDEHNVMACDVDIYVVRPIIRNPEAADAQIYYLFMNEIPWTTHGFNTPNDGTGASDIPKKGQNTTSTANTQQTNTLAPSPNLPQKPSGDSAYYTPDPGKYVNGVGHVVEIYNIGTAIEPEYDGSRVGQPCTAPSQYAAGFDNSILTTGRYASISPAFEKAMITKFRTEGGCVDHPQDSGGYTCYGVSSKYFPQVKNPNFSRADAEDIAWKHFFKKYNMDKLPDAISGDVFMALWGTGSVDKSIGILRQLLGLKREGVVDEQLIKAAKEYHGDLRTQYLDARKQFFLSTKNETFLQGWLNALDVYRANGCHTIVQDIVQ